MENSEAVKIEIAKTIINQMGGYRILKLLVNARNSIALEFGVMFEFSGSRNINKFQSS